MEVLPVGFCSRVEAGSSNSSGYLCFRHSRNFLIAKSFSSPTLPYAISRWNVDSDTGQPNCLVSNAHWAKVILYLFQRRVKIALTSSTEPFFRVILYSLLFYLIVNIRCAFIDVKEKMLFI